MSFGSNTTSRFEIETAKGKQGIFFLPKRTKQKTAKKFGYKDNKLRHSIRNSNQTQDVPSEEIIKKPVNPDTNFIKKNRDRLAGRTEPNNKVKPLNGGTVTLTQEQLNSILESVGNLKQGKENALRISIDPKTNSVKVTSPRPGDAEVTSSRSDKSVKPESKRKSDTDEIVLGLLDNEEKLNTEDDGKSDNTDVENFKNEISARKEKTNLDRRKTEDKLKEKEDGESPVKNVKERVLNLPPVPLSHLTIAEKKRLQWEREKGELENYDPWGRPGAGAPVRNNEGNILADYKNRQEEIKSSPVKHSKPVVPSPRSQKQSEEPVTGTLNIGHLSDKEELLTKKEESQRKLREDLEKQLEEKRQREKLNREKEKLDDTWANQLSNDYRPAPLPPQLATFVSSSNKNSPRVNKVQEIPVNNQSPSWVKDQKILPAAMRSSFAFGGLASDDSKYKQTKQEEKRKWLEDLEKQKDEKRMLTLTEKEKLKVSDSSEGVHWADHVSPRQDKSSEYNITATQSDLNYDMTSSGNMVNDSARSNSAPEAQPSTLIRGQNVVIDPLTLKDLEFKRKQHIEHQAAIKSQIEEKKNNVRQQREKKWAEEQDMEMRLQREREVIQNQFDTEQQKLQEKEQVREQQLQQLKTAMDEAHERALHEKHLKRMHHLQQGGHDITNLKANYEVISPSPAPIERSTAASVARQPKDNYYAMSPRVQPSHQSSTVPQLSLSVREADTTMRSYNSDSHHPDEHNHQIHHDDYIQDRVLTPLRYRNMSDPHTDPYSTQRHFGTQTITDEDGFKRQVSEVKIEYKIAENDRERKSVPTNKNKRVRLKSAAHVKTYKPEKPKAREKVGWNYKNPDKKKAVKNSERDPFYEEKKRESQTRHAKRAAQLYKMVEANKPMIPTEHPPGSRDPSPRRNKSLSPYRNTKYSSPRLDRSLSPHFRSETRLINPTVPSPHRSQDDHRLRPELHGKSPPVPAVKHRRQHNAYLDDRGYENNYDTEAYNYNNYHPSNGQSKHRSHYTDVDPVRPPVYDNDFVPFTRTTEVLDPSHADEPVPVSRENTRVTRGRKAYRDNQQPADYGNKIDNYEDRNRDINIKDPILNPGLVTDHPTSRQDQILLQLSKLKQNLIQRQRELETCMSPSAFDQD